ncbi:hypothetical protein [Aliigemmobacter aestuarii]|uniref:hypothetical protein n=1 Tax=Aliigemmobacter aestuarii TaxID=1445661 RepID=UPI001B3B2758|nr:hypothetical protein [Gemmobacter aestuarii]
MFRIGFSPVRSEDRLSLSLDGDRITINGQRFDLAPLDEGAALPAFHPWVEGEIVRQGGVILLRLRLPHGPDAPEEARFPKPATDASEVPGNTPWDGEVIDQPVDWAGMIPAESRNTAALREARALALQQVTARLEAVALAITGAVPLVEMLSWGPKEAAARAWVSGDAGAEARALIEGEATVTGEEPGTLAVRILANADAYRAAVAALTGLRRKAEVALAAAATPAEVGAVAAGIDDQLRTMAG